MAKGFFRGRGTTWVSTGLSAGLAVMLAVTAGGTVTGERSAGAGATEAAVASSLAGQIDALLADPRYSGSQVGVVVRDAETGDTLYNRDGDDRLLPASNTKLFTSAAAMDLLGPDYRFTTTVSTAGRQVGPLLAGDIHLTGGGDPTVLASDYADLARQLADKGIRIVRGDLVADDSVFDKQRLGPFWSWDDEPFYYSAQISALTVAPDTDYDSGSVIVETRPGAKVGDPAPFTLVPDTSYVKVVNEAVTGPAGSANTVAAEREHGINTIHVTGSYPISGSVNQEWATVWEPTGYAADVFLRALQAQGVSADRQGAHRSYARRHAHHREPQVDAPRRPAGAVDEAVQQHAFRARR